MIRNSIVTWLAFSDFLLRDDKSLIFNQLYYFQSENKVCFLLFVVVNSEGIQTINTWYVSVQFFNDFPLRALHVTKELISAFAV